MSDCSIHQIATLHARFSRKNNFLGSSLFFWHFKCFFHVFRNSGDLLVFYGIRLAGTSCNWYTCNCVYIGETKRHFLVRASEHLGMSILTGNPYTYNENTATAVNQHCHSDDHHHAASIEDFEVVGHANNKFHLRLKEALLIGVVKPTIINVQKKSVPLCLFGGWLGVWENVSELLLFGLIVVFQYWWFI